MRVVSVMRVKSHALNKTPLLLLLGLSMWLSHLPLVAESCGIERDFPSKSAEVEAALHSIKAYGGDRLPTLEGFAASAEAPLSLFRRGYYQYELQVIPLDGGSTRVRVCAKITAWLEDANSAAGYRQLSSNGRLEGDLIDRLREAINTLPLASLETPSLIMNKPSDNSTEADRPSTRVPEADGGKVERPPPGPGTAESHSAVKAGAFTVPRTPGIPSYQPLTAEGITSPAEEKAYEKLTLQARSLEQALSSQTHPLNLVSILHTNSPIFDRPNEAGKVLLYANAEDEFQRESESGDWVQVQISGTSRGWVRRSLLEAAAPPLPDHRSTSTLGKSPVTSGMTEQVSVFPGKWQPLDGKQVKVISVEPSPNAGPLASKKSLSASVFRKAYLEFAKSNTEIAGVVIIFDSADGLMAAATKESLQQWGSGHLTSSAFWKQCYLDPLDAFKATE